LETRFVVQPGLVSVTKLSGTGPGVAVSLEEPIMISGGEFRTGAVRTHAERLELGALSLGGFTVEITAAGGLERPALKLRGAIQEPRFGTIIFPRLELSGSYNAAGFIAALSHAASRQGALEVELSRFPA